MSPGLALSATATERKGLDVRCGLTVSANIVILRRKVGNKMEGKKMEGHLL